MRTKTKKCDDVTLVSLEIYDNLEQQCHNYKQWPTISSHLLGTLEAVQSNPTGDVNMEFDEYNTRYGCYTSLVGAISESIAALNISTTFDSPITFATDQLNQSQNKIDLWVGSYTVQVKTVCINHDQIANQDDWQFIETDWISLVDIDDYHHWLFGTNVLKQFTQPHITINELMDNCTYYFNNVMLYGSKYDKIVHQKIVEKQE